MVSTRVRGPAYRIQTQRLILRCWEPRDAPLLKEAIDNSLDHLRPWMPWAADEPEALQDKITRLRNWRGQFDLGKEFVYAIFGLEEQRVLGSCGLHTRVGPEAREIGYWIHADHINKGLATEAAGALARIAFEVDGVVRVEIHCDPDNVRSSAVARKLGFAHEATLRARAVDCQGKRRDSMIWTLLRDEYRRSELRDIAIQAWDAAGRRIL